MGEGTFSDSVWEATPVTLDGSFATHVTAHPTNNHLKAMVGAYKTLNVCQQDQGLAGCDARS